MLEKEWQKEVGGGASLLDGLLAKADYDWATFSGKKRQQGKIVY